MEPPTTPIGRDELALKRHRFFSDLLEAAQAAMEHRVRFDPLGPFVADVTPIDEVPTPSAEPTHHCDKHSNFIAINYIKLFSFMYSPIILLIFALVDGKFIGFWSCQTVLCGRY